MTETARNIPIEEGREPDQTPPELKLVKGDASEETIAVTGIKDFGRRDFRDYGACGPDAGNIVITLDYDPFIPLKKSQTRLINDGKAICAMCDVDVKLACEIYALENGEASGTWGGKSEWERPKTKKKREAALKQIREDALKKSDEGLQS